MATTTPLDQVSTALSGRYQIERELGAGGMATVYLAHDERHSRKVAVKVLRPELAVTLGPERFLREITIAANLTHPHIVPLHDSGEVDGFLYYVMPYIEGETLGNRIRRDQEIPIDEAVQIIREVTDALGFAHSRGVVHRDIKPDNVMLTDRHAVVTDFGIAKAVSGTSAEGITTAGITLGTPSYMSPEQATADPNIDHRSDIYALGAMAYELLAGRTPFTGPNPQAILAAHVTETPEPISKHRTELSNTLESAVMRCLAKNPGDRWQSAEELWTELGTAANQPAAPQHLEARRHAIVVLPFTNQSPDPENEYFSDGLTEEIIADLSKIKALSVISRTSAMQLKGTNKDMRTIGRELGVRYVLEGSVRKAGQSLRITAELIDALTDEQLWADKYNGTMDDVFDLQERVSREIVAALDVTLTPDEEQHLADRPIVDARAFELYLQARAEVRRYGASVERAQELLSQAIAIEGETPPLRALMAWIKVTQVRSGIAADLTVLDEADAVARDLIDLDPNSSYGHAVLGYTKNERGLPAEAVGHLEKALERQPNDADILFQIGVTYNGAGQYEQATETAKYLLACDPLSPLAWMLSGVLPWFTGHHEAGVDFIRHAAAMDPKNLIVRWCAGYTFACLNRLDEADEHAAVIRDLGPDVPYTRQLCALIEGVRGHPDRALEQLAPIDLTHLDGHHKFHLAESYAMAGATERALDLLDQAVQLGFYPYPYIAEHCPMLEPLRGEARFAEIAEEAKRLVEAFE